MKETNERISLRLKRHLAARFNRVVRKSKRTQTSIVEECLDAELPKLERRLGLNGNARAA